MTEPLVQIRGLHKAYYGVPVLSNVSFDIAPGEVFGYIGPNGAGKTTTLKILAGLITKYEGQVTIDGVDVARERKRVHALLGYQPQSSGFQSWRTVESALDSLGELSGVADDVRAKRISVLLERFKLSAARTKKVKDLSGGMTQKLGLVQALLHEPKLLVLDEPLEGLDPPSRSLLKDIIRERQRAGTTVLFSSHILSDVEDVADRVGILNAGALAISGSIRELGGAFGMPIEIGVEFSQVPSETAFLSTHGEATERKPGEWRVAMPKGADLDGAIHAIIEATLAKTGKLRKVGVVEPELDDLFAKYILATGPQVEIDPPADPKRRAIMEATRRAG